MIGYAAYRLLVTSTPCLKLLVVIIGDANNTTTLSCRIRTGQAYKGNPITRFSAIVGINQGYRGGSKTTVNRGGYVTKRNACRPVSSVKECDLPIPGVSPCLVPEYLEEGITTIVADTGDYLVSTVVRRELYRRENGLSGSEPCIVTSGCPALCHRQLHGEQVRCRRI